MCPEGSHSHTKNGTREESCRILLADLSICCSHRAETALTGSPIILHFDCALQAVSVLEADKVEPAGEGECPEALAKEVVKYFEDVLGNPKGVAKEILSLLVFPRISSVLKGNFSRLCSGTYISQLSLSASLIKYSGFTSFF